MFRLFGGGILETRPKLIELTEDTVNLSVELRAPEATFPSSVCVIPFDPAALFNRFPVNAQ